MTAPRVTVDTDAGDHRTAVRVDGEPFTAYLEPGADPVLAKPVCYPIRAASGTPVTRGYPLDPRPGERVDHPHHVGLWLNYGNVSGYDFWNNAGPVTGDDDGPVVRHRETRRAESGDGRGELAVTLEWVAGGRALLREETTVRFHAAAGERAIDRLTTLTALRDVELADDKEGLLGLRVCRDLEHPDDDPAAVVGPDGGTREVVDTAVTGEYESSRGDTGTALWGSRAEWVKLAGRVGDEPVSVVVMDHPDNAGHPTHWHARGYGLFAANPLGAAAFTDGERRLGFALGEGESATFDYRVSVIAGDPDDVAERYDAFVAAAREG
ncbi:MAG: PmoA family protein [Halobacteriaceae archaeon]